MTDIAVGFARSGVGAFTSRLARRANGLELAADGSACGTEGVPRGALRTRRGGRSAPVTGTGHAKGPGGAS